MTQPPQIANPADIPQLLEQLYQALSQPDELLDETLPVVEALTTAIQAHLKQATVEQLTAEQQELEQLRYVLGILVNKASGHRESLKQELLNLKRSQQVKKSYGA
jgi:hypothetical protein